MRRVPLPVAQLEFRRPGGGGGCVWHSNSRTSSSPRPLISSLLSCLWFPPSPIFLLFQPLHLLFASQFVLFFLLPLSALLLTLFTSISSLLRLSADSFGFCPLPSPLSPPSYTYSSFASCAGFLRLPPLFSLTLISFYHQCFSNPISFLCSSPYYCYYYHLTMQNIFFYIYASTLSPSCCVSFLHLIFVSFLFPVHYFLYYLWFFFSLFIFTFSSVSFLPLSAFFIPFSHLSPASPPVLPHTPLCSFLFSASHTINFFFLDIFDCCPPCIPTPPPSNCCSPSLYLLCFLPYASTFLLIDLFFHTSPLPVLPLLLMQVEGLWPAHPQGDPPSAFSGTWGSSAAGIRGCVQGGTPPLSWRQ